MQNIFDFYSEFKKTIQTDFSTSYNLDVWTEMAAHENWIGSNAKQALFENLMPGFELVDYTTNVQIHPDPWTPCMTLFYIWELEGMKLNITVDLVKEQVHNVRFVDMKSVHDHFGKEYDFVGQLAQMLTAKKLASCY